jgi:hypothetical protein
MIQIGLKVQFYKYKNGVFQKLGGELDLVSHVHTVIKWANHLKANPMPVV